MNATLAQTVTAVQWVVAEGVDLAGRWGHEDATEGKRRGGDMFTLLSPEYSSYHAGYNAGLRLRQQLQGDVCPAALDECAWFDEIIGAGPVVTTFSNDALDATEEEAIGALFSCKPYLF